MDQEGAQRRRFAADRGRATKCDDSYRSAWDTRDGEVFSHVPAKARQKYAEFYDELDSNTKIINRELDLWMSLRRYEIPLPVTADDRRTIYGALSVEKVLNFVWGLNMGVSSRITDELGIKPIRPDNIPRDFLAQVGKCKPIFTDAASSGERTEAPARS